MARLPIEAVADASQAKTELDSLGQTGSASMEGIGVAGVALGNILSDVVMKGVELVKDAFVGVINAGQEWVELSNIQEDAVNKLNQALKSAGDFSAAASEDMQAFTVELQNITGVGDATSLQMLALAKSFGASNEQAKLMTTAAIDFGVAAGINATEALRRLGRATRGSVDDVAKFVPEIKNLTKEQLAAGEATQLIADRFAGVGAAAAQTFSGRMGILGERVGDAKESLGDMIKEGLEPLVPVLENLVTKGEEFIAKYGEEIGEKLRAVGETVAELAGRFGDFMAAHNEEIIKAIANALKLLVDAGAFAVKTAAKLGEIYGFVREAFAKTMLFLKPTIDGFIMLGKAQAFLTRTEVPAFITGLEDISIGLVENVKDQQAFRQKMTEMGDAAVKTAEELQTRFKAGIDDASNSLQGMTEKQDLVGLKGDELVAALRRQGDAAVEMGSDWVKTGEMLDEAGNKIEDTWARAGETIDEFGRAIIIPQIPETTENIDEAAASTDKLAGSMTRAGSAAGAMGQAVVAAAQVAKQAIFTVAEGARQAMMETSHAAAVAASDAARAGPVTAGGSAGGAVGTRELIGSGQTAQLDPKRLRQILSRLKGAEGATPGFFRNITQAFTQELSGGGDIGKLERIMDTFSANQRAIQAMTNRANLGLEAVDAHAGPGTAAMMSGIEQIMAQVLTEMKRVADVKIDGPGVAGELQNLLERGEART